METGNIPIEPYARAHDIIAVIELRLLDLDEYIEDVEKSKRKIENALRMDVEIQAEDKASGLTNEKKRQIAYEELADRNKELQYWIFDVKEARRTQNKLKIEQQNELRAYNLLLRDDKK